ncbi:unnamed protein product [Echinostoma caproni]|uniref:Myosin motor domain-containing protein n=1 Tax=Echinostoma caproni TaxID=27848 RepID=A0A183AFZ4_9TREM|nr:unnamed protein product [Echinostoma caproni]
MVFEDSIVLDQLRYTGVLEATRIRKSGFPVRPTYQDLLNRYGFLIAKSHYKQLRSIEDPKEAVCYLLQHLDISVGEHGNPQKGLDYELGDTKLFMRNKLAVDLEAICTIIQHRSARIIQEAWRKRGDGLYERARHNAATVIQSHFRGYLARRQNPAISRIAAQRAPVEVEPEEPVESLSDLEISRLEIPSDLAFILEEKPMDQLSWLNSHKVTKPRGSIRRLLSNHPASGWQTYGRPVWDAQPLSYLVRSQLGFRLAPRKRPILLTQATEGQQAAAAAASKLVLRLIHLPEQPIMDQFLIGSYLYQLGLVNKSLHKEILAQLLSQSVNWPDQAGLTEESDKEDEESLFETTTQQSRAPQTYSIAEGNVQGVIRDRNPIGSSDLQRRAFRRLWMHVAGVLTCGRLSGTLKPVVVRFMRQHGPVRSVPLCEDRLVMAPSVPRLYPPCLLEWRVNYTGNNMGIDLKFPDGLSSVIHVGCFTRAETLAGMAMALRPKSPTDIAADARVAGAPPDSPLPPDVTGTRKSTTALPHEMRYYTYERPGCSIQLRKEFISPKERIRSSLVLTLVFAQVVSDAKDYVNPRLRSADRQMILDMVGDRYLSKWPESLKSIPLEVKKQVVQQSLKFPFYFGRFYPILYLDNPISVNDCHWLVVAHHGIRVVFQSRDRPDFDLKATLELGDIKQVQANHVVARPRWRLGDDTQSEHPGVAGYLSSETKPVDVVGGLKNMLQITTTDKVHQFYTELAERIQENVNDFLKEYEQEVRKHIL